MRTYCDPGSCVPRRLAATMATWALSWRASLWASVSHCAGWICPP
nr:MAG TPA: hypothetical protein [Caudoviricetes sp.]